MPLTHLKRTPEVVDHILKAYTVEHKSARMIARELGVNPTTVQRALYQAGVMRDRNTAMRLHSERTQKRNKAIEQRVAALLLMS